MASGFLSGKYNEGVIPDYSRVKKTDPFWGHWIEITFFTREKKEKVLKICRGIAEIAKEEGYTQP